MSHGSGTSHSSPEFGLDYPLVRGMWGQRRPSGPPGPVLAQSRSADSAFSLPAPRFKQYVVCKEQFIFSSQDSMR